MCWKLSKSSFFGRIEDCLTLSVKNSLEYFIISLWPSQNIWTLPTDKSMKVMDSLAVRSVQILNTGSSPLVKSFFFGWMPIFKNRKRNKKLKALRIVFYYVQKSCETMKKKSCLKKLKLCEVSGNPKSSIYWRFQKNR